MLPQGSVMIVNNASMGSRARSQTLGADATPEVGEMGGVATVSSRRYTTGFSRRYEPAWINES
jgi:hypothetical protein